MENALGDSAQVLVDTLDGFDGTEALQLED